MADLLPVLTKLRDDPDLVQRFTEDPEGVIQELGVDPSEVTIARLPGGNSPYENFKQVVDKLETAEPVQRRTICGSVGYIACGSIGG
ncbi:MAG TPA: hypothetical protein VF526_17670 [Solirubrobacteraceae bacterium]